MRTRASSSIRAPILRSAATGKIKTIGSNGGPNKKASQWTPLIERAARDMQVDHALLHAVVETESSYNPNAVSVAGAVGLMQLMPATADRYGVKDRYDPTQNVYGGTRYLRDLMRQFRDLKLALAAYNAGEGAVIKYGRKIPPYPETQKYVTKVLKRYQKRRGAIPRSAIPQSKPKRRSIKIRRVSK